ncbi:MAG: hypothetical protein H3C39_02405 [Flavobacteriia bacterium]|nr:hypothetical protein [Flavobacteriia bacterium]
MVKDLWVFDYLCEYKSFGMETLIVKKAKKEDLDLLLNVAKKMGMDIERVPKRKIVDYTEEEIDEAIMKLSKKVNKSITKRMFKEMGLDYDSYSRQ